MHPPTERIHAPRLAPGEWVNTAEPPRADWRGRLTVVDLWDFT